MKTCPRLFVSGCCVLGLALCARAADEIPESLKTKGLVRNGTQFVLSSEESLAQALRNVKTVQMNYLKAFRDADQLYTQLLQTHEEFVAIKTRGVQAKQQLAGSVGKTAKTQAILQAGKQDQARLAELSKMLASDPAEVIGAFAVLAEVRKLYAEAILEAANQKEAALREYAVIAKDSAVSADLEAIGKKDGKPFTLGPSRTFDANVKSVDKYREFATVRTIKLTQVGGSLRIPVDINGKTFAQMKIIKGGNSITINQGSATQSKIPFGDFDPVASAISANQTRFNLKRSLVSSVQVGESEVGPVIVSIKDGEAQDQDNMIGDQFLGRYFVYSLDEKGLALTLTEIEDPAAKKSIAKPKKRR